MNLDGFDPRLVTLEVRARSMGYSALVDVQRPAAMLQGISRDRSDQRFSQDVNDHLISTC
jgi:hypothetical protein